MKQEQLRFEKFWTDRKLEVFRDWAEKYDKTLLANAWEDWCIIFRNQLIYITPRPSSYWELDDARKLIFVNWVEDCNAYGFGDWLDERFKQAMEPGWNVGDSE